ncbi:hypothetical protein J6590_000246 [Homalodisca vitripennis]|nr:hypothetical protein J6590_000241 [Homalodisca vitripennis]KAG8338574.1 hypothetical protein J6590_000246 [Homalodisca vitripennis]
MRLDQLVRLTSCSLRTFDDQLYPLQNHNNDDIVHPGARHVARLEDRLVPVQTIGTALLVVEGKGGCVFPCPWYVIMEAVVAADPNCIPAAAPSPLTTRALFLHAACNRDICPDINPGLRYISAIRSFPCSSSPATKAAAFYTPPSIPINLQFERCPIRTTFNNGRMLLDFALEEVKYGRYCAKAMSPLFKNERISKSSTLYGIWTICLYIEKLINM